MNSLKLIKLNFAAKATRGAYLPPYLGNSLRGALGQSLYRRNCIRPGGDCSYCSKASTCPYSCVFKSQAQVEGLDSVPNPFVISFEWDKKNRYEAGDMLDFSITLIGTGCLWKDELIAAVGEMFQKKLSCLALDSVTVAYEQEWSDEGQLPEVSTVAIHLKTPLVFLSSKALVTEIDFPSFIDSVFVRIAGINDTYGETEFVLPFSLTHRKPKIISENKLESVTIKQEKQPIVGLVGEIRFSGELTRYMPYLDLCSEIHMGKMTTRGCGRYEYTIVELT
ncbi:MAG: CRISPR system precrRNA processing endoribonuclease RAMP protein Cas6 [Clostridiales bacterium]|jgi:hypothetical protein|nr:CRISPR system precrRNA processing endoribonuclease RAMP protein Cas6 [Clostridiales bacterium]MDR2749113.1 CRISPR system precrRNA processing endoribonuclease RAMP protein Cas6 [Clostridiales bacterium]